MELRLPDPLRITEIAPCTPGLSHPLPLLLARIPAGFPSPADDYIDKTLDLNELIVKNPAATYLVAVEGESMVGAGIHPGDVLVVDRSVEAQSGHIVVASLHGELTIKQVRVRGGKVWLIPENALFDSILVTPEMDFNVWGVVTHVIHALAR